jgi:hypothetical protein
MKALILSHAHPTFSIGGAQVGLLQPVPRPQGQDGWDAHYLAASAPPWRATWRPR